MDDKKQSSSHRQFVALQNVLKALHLGVVGKNLNLSYVLQESSFDVMYHEFSEHVPITSLLGYVNYLRTLTLQSRDKSWEVVSVPHLLTSSACSAVFPRSGGAYPLSRQLLEGGFAVERALVDGTITGVSAVKGKIFHLTDEMDLEAEPSMLVGDFRRLRLSFMPHALKKRIFPKPEIFDDIGLSRYQRLHRLIDELEAYGDTVGAIVSRPQVLCDFALVLSQRYGKVMTLHDLCPKLQVLAHYAEPIGPYEAEIDDFLGKSAAQKVKVLFAPSGLLAIQSDVSKGNVVTLHDETGVFYEFIPQADLRPDGSLLSHHRRMHAGQVVPNSVYLLALSNTSGLLGYNTNRLVKVVSVNPLRVEYLCFAHMLNYFEEHIQLDVLEQVLSTVNKSAKKHGFHIREYMIGDDVDAEKSYWLFEVNKSLSHLQESDLTYIVNTLHQEMSLRNPHYRALTQGRPEMVPHMVFVPVGTFSSLTQSVDRRHIDDTEDAAHIHKMLDLVQDKIILRPTDI